MGRRGGAFRRFLWAAVVGMLGVTACEAKLEPAAHFKVDAWVKPKQVVGGDVERGRRLLRVYGCGACHVVPGVPGASGKVGPPLTAMAERALIAGRLANAPENMVRWIMNPQQVDPGTAMPDLGVSDAEARDMAAYLYTLR